MGRLAWVGVLLAVGLGTAGVDGVLAPPSVADPGSWGQWAGSRTPVEGAFAVLGLVVVVLAWYLLAVTALLAVGRLWGSARLVSMAEVLTLPAVRRLVHASLGLTLAGTAVVGANGGTRVAGGDGRVVAQMPPVVLVSTAVIPGGAAGADDVAGVDEEVPSAEEVDPAGPPPVMRRLPAGPPAAADGPSDPLGADDGPSTPSGANDDQVAAPRPGGDGSSQWEIRPGDHLWSVAARTLATAWGTDPTDDEVAPYWRQVVAANRDRLVDPANPDLVFPGQVMAVVTPPPSPR